MRKIEITLNMSVGDHKQSILEKMLWHSPYKPIMLWLPRQCTARVSPQKATCLPFHANSNERVNSISHVCKTVLYAFIVQRATNNKLLQLAF